MRLSNTLGDGMVLQQAPAAATIWGSGAPGLLVETTFKGSTFKSIADAQGVWRTALPPTVASSEAHTIFFNSSQGSARLSDVLFGEVFLCSGQSNMAYTPHSMAGMDNASAEIAAADAPRYRDIRLFTVGQGTRSKTILRNLTTVYRGWTPASSRVLGGAAWKEFSAICWLFGRRLHDELGVPIGLISSNWGATSIQVWMNSVANEQCRQGNWSGDRYNAMIAPFAVGPMRLAGVAWYQGESNQGQGRYYSCAFPAMVAGWRRAFSNQSFWFGFVQIAGYRYGGASRPDPSGDLRQAQLAALALPNVSVATTIDVGDWMCVHPVSVQRLQPLTNPACSE